MTITLFFYSLFCSFFISIVFPSYHPLFFAPFLAASIYRCSFLNCIYWATLCGFVVDLLSSQTRLGFYSLIYVLAIMSLYRLKMFFFKEHFSTQAILTFFFSFLTSSFHAFIFFIIGRSFSISADWFFIDLFLFPLGDVLYGMIAWTFPCWLAAQLNRSYIYWKRRRRVYD